MQRLSYSLPLRLLYSLLLLSSTPLLLHPSPFLSAFPICEVLQHHAPLAGSVQGVQHLRYCVCFSLATFHLQDAFQYFHTISLIGQFDVRYPVCYFQVKSIHPSIHIKVTLIKHYFLFLFYWMAVLNPKPLIVFVAPKCHQTPSC